MITNSTLYIDTASCNLHCKMCPRGGVHDIKNTARGVMSFDLFREIVNKIKNENVTIDRFYIGNWGEAFLNSDLEKIILYGNHNLSPKVILVNSNLSVNIKEPERLLTSGISILCVSLSGMRQEIYEQNHSGGDINKVLINLKMLCDTREQLGINYPVIQMAFHQYIYNKEDEKIAIEFCKANDIIFMPTRCYVCSVEEGIKFAHDNNVKNTYSNFINIDVEIAKMHTLGSGEDCHLSHEIVINFDGNIFKCCGTYGEDNMLGNFFDLTINEILTSFPDICKVCRNTPLSWR